MILLTALHLIRTIWADARAMQREAHKRFPHLHSD